MELYLTCSECNGPLEGRWNSEEGGISITPCEKCRDDLKEIVEDNKREFAVLKDTIENFKKNVKEFHTKLEEIPL